MSKCKVCRGEYVKRSMTHKCCSTECAIIFAMAERTKNASRIAKKARQDTRQRLNELKTLSDLHNEAQTPFNKFIRLRDKDEPCISCQRYHTGQYHAGHFIPRGRGRHLAYNEDNVHKQCSACNDKLGGNVTEYRKNLILKIGEAKVIELENDHTVKRWTREELIEIKRTYQRKANELSKLQGL